MSTRTCLVKPAGRSRRAVGALLWMGFAAGCGADPPTTYLDSCVPGDSDVSEGAQRVCRADGTWSAWTSRGCVPGATERCRPYECYTPDRYATRACRADGTWAGCSCYPAAPPAPDGGDCDCQSGCCAGDRSCRVGNTAEACGGDNVACVACAAGELCVGRRCTAPRAGLTLVVVSAVVPSVDPSLDVCSSWDCPGFLGHPSEADLPDPYVRERSRGYRTGTLTDTLSPNWNEPVATGLTAADLTRPFAFELVDDDRSDPLNAHDLVATFTVELRPEEVTPGRFEHRALVGGQPATLTLELR